MNQKTSANIIWLIRKDKAEGKVLEIVDKTLCCFVLDSWIHKNLVMLKFVFLLLELKPKRQEDSPHMESAQDARTTDINSSSLNQPVIHRSLIWLNKQKQLHISWGGTQQPASAGAQFKQSTQCCSQ